MDERPVNLTVQLPSGASMFPSWITVLFIGAFVLASVALLLVWEANRELAQAVRDTGRETGRELRIQQVHLMDLEDMLIRHGLANRSDFAQWEEGTPRHAPAKEPAKEK